MRWSFGRHRDDEWLASRTKAERRMIRLMEKKGGKGFRVLRSAETTMKRYQRSTAQPRPDTDPSP